METLTYPIQINANVVKFRAQVPAHRWQGIVGDYKNGQVYQPNNEEVLKVLPYKYRKAFDRALKWWQESSLTGRNLPLKCDLTTLRGKPIGTLYATPNWVA